MTLYIDKKIEHNIAEFASRWRRELAPEQVAAGKNLSKQKATLGKNYMKSTLSNNEGFKAKARQVATKKNFEIQASIKGLQDSAKAQKASLLSNNKADPLIKQNKNLRSYLENRKIDNYQGNTKLGKATTAPKTIRRAPTGLNKVRANQKAVANQKFGEQIKEATKPIPTPVSLPTTSVPRPTSSRPLPQNPIPKRNLPKPQVEGIPFKKPGLLGRIGGAIKRNPVAAGAGLGAIGAGIGYGVYKKMKSNNSRQK